MAKSGKILKIVGGVALLYYIATTTKDKLTNNLSYGFKSLRFINFWDNIKRLKIELETVLTIANGNTVEIVVKQFKGALTFREELLVHLVQDIPVVLKPKTRQPIRFVFKADVLAAAAKVYLAFNPWSEAQKSVEGCKIKGDLSVVLEGIPFTVPYEQDVAIGV